MTQMSIHNIQRLVIEKTHSLEVENRKVFVRCLYFIDDKDNKTTINLFSDDEKNFIIKKK